MPRRGSWKKVILLLLLLVLFFVAGVWSIDWLASSVGLRLDNPILERFRQQEKTSVREDSFLLEREELQKEKMAFEIREENLKKEMEKVKKEAQELDIKKEHLEEEIKRYKDLQKVLNQRMNEYENKKENIKKTADYLYNMPPQNAVSILSKQSDTMIIDLLRQIDGIALERGQGSLTPYYLSLMEPEKAAAITRKMNIKPAEEEE